MGRSGYVLFSNRDEKIARLPGSPPEIGKRSGVQFAAPSDTAFGGTWLASNEFGVTLALLNGESKTPGARSRGCLPLELVGARSLSEVLIRLQAIDLSPFAAFMLLAIEPGRDALVWAWSGRNLTVNRKASAPLASSSFDYHGVQRVRREQFARLPSFSADALREFHANHVDGPSAYSPCMHREDARTVSFTEIRVTRSAVTLAHRAGAPCEDHPQQSLTLARRT
jgi:hypothetical protein